MDRALPEGIFSVRSHDFENILDGGLLQLRYQKLAKGKRSRRLAVNDDGLADIKESDS